MEHLNKNLADMLCMYTTDTAHKNWDQILPYVTFAYINAQQETSLIQFNPWSQNYDDIGRYATAWV